jgi:hypothetical protein
MPIVILYYFTLLTSNFSHLSTSIFFFIFPLFLFPFHIPLHPKKNSGKSFSLSPEGGGKGGGRRIFSDLYIPVPYFQIYKLVSEKI